MTAGVRLDTLPRDRDPIHDRTTSVFVPERPSGSATPFFLLPGFGLDGRSFAALSPLAESRRVVFWNPPNDLPAGRDLSAIADLALEDAELSGCGERVILGGASLGGFLALHAALRHPERVAGLVLFGAPSGFSDLCFWARMAATFHDLAPRRRYHRLLPRALVPSSWDPPGGSPLNDALRTQMAHRTRAYGERLVGALRRDDGTVRRRLAEIEQPTLVIHGARDVAVPPRATRTLARLPSSRVIVLDSAGHVPFASHATSCLQALVPFLSEVDAHGRGRTR
jgi:pimeloyl-[acyl-carrier protein] methyl ester esterase